VALAADELERVWGTLAAAPVATAVVGPDGRFLKVNAALCALVGHPEPALLAAGYSAVVHPEDRDADLEHLGRLVGGEPLHLDAHGRPRFVVRQLVDLRQGHPPEDQLAWRATHDALTGLPNRSLFLDRLEMTLARLGRERDAVRLAERMTAGLATPFAVGGQEIVVTASIGIALTGSRTRRASSLLSDADTALQRAKHRGGGLYELFDETVRAQLIERLELEQALRQAVDGDELRTLYPPIVSLKEGRLVGVEALVRWDQPGRGRPLPAEFVPFAEETGLIVPLGAWVLAESCRQAARWRANGPRILPPTVHVNLSPRQFAEPRLLDLVAGALADTGTDPACAWRSPSGPWPPTRPRPPPPSSACPPSGSGSRSTTSAPATRPWPRSSTAGSRVDGTRRRPPV
jgi:hypothetical protein